MEVEVLMKRMVELQQQEEEWTQEEMVTRFEKERSESIPTGTKTCLLMLSFTCFADVYLGLYFSCLTSGGEGSPA